MKALNPLSLVMLVASDEKVVIKGSEIVKGWAKVQNDTRKVTRKLW